MTNLNLFHFGDTEVRVIQKDGEFWWVAADICSVLELTNSSMVLQKLDDDEKGLFDPKQYLGSASNQDFWAINESGLYSLILRSRKPQAKTFKRWVTHDVLPSIRKTGSYSVRKPLPPMSHETQLAMAQLAYTVACDTNNLRLKIAVGSSLQNALMPPKMDAATQTELLSVTEVCERHGIRLPKGKDSSVGRQIAKQWREEFNSEPATAPKMLANGHRAAEVKIYPENWLEPLLEGIREVFERNAKEGRQP